MQTESSTQKPWLAASIALLAVAILGSGSGAAEAAGGKVFSIGDKKSGATVKVFRSGQLSVGDGSGPLTVDGTVKVGGTARVTDGSGPMTVDGVVGEALPSTFVTTAAAGVTLTGGAGCTSFDVPLPTGAPLLVERVAVILGNVQAGDAGRAQVTLLRKVGGVASTLSALPIPVDAGGGFVEVGGNLEIDAVIQPADLASAAEGQYYGLRACLSRGNAPAGAVGKITVIGRR